MQHTTASNLKTLKKFGVVRVTPQRQPNLMPRSLLHSAAGSPFLWILRFSQTTARFTRWGSLHRLSFGLIFNNYARAIRSTDTNVIYQINNIALEFDIVTHHDLARLMRQQYMSQTVVLYTRIFRHRMIALKKSDATWNINLNTPGRSPKGVLLLFKDPAPGAMGPAFGRNSEIYYIPRITKVQVTVEGIPNQLYAQGMLAYQHWDKIVKGFACTDSSTDMSTYYRNRYGLWLDFRSSDDQKLHGSGRRVGSASEGVTLQLDKTPEPAGPLKCYVYIVMDARLNIGSGQLIYVIF